MTKDTVKTEQPQKQKKSDKDTIADLSKKYRKLKFRYKTLRAEYTKVLESWELGAKSIKSLINERRFLTKKLDTIMKSQHFIDEDIFKTKEEEAKVAKKVNVDLSLDSKAQGQARPEMKKDPSSSGNDIQILDN